MVIAAVLGLPAAAGAATDVEPSVQCGDVITEDTVVNTDLDCGNSYEEPALTIGAPGITLDFDGHILRSSGMGVANEGHDDVTIRNLDFRGENSAVYLRNVSGNVVGNVKAFGLYGGITLDNSDHNRIIENHLSSVILALANGSDHNTVARNVVTQYEGFVSISGSDENRIVDNILWSNDDTPLHLTDAHRNLIRNNRLITVYNAIARLSESHRNEFAHNTVVAYGSYRGPGLILTGSDRNLVLANDFHGTPLAVWLRSGSRNELIRNDARGERLDTFTDAEPDGFRVEAAATRTLLDRNSASGFADDGFDIASRTSLLRRNTATGNGDYGIDAVVPTVDLGGNRASGNGQPAQCRNVRCR